MYGYSYVVYLLRLRSNLQLMWVNEFCPLVSYGSRYVNRFLFIRTFPFRLYYTKYLWIDVGIFLSWCVIWVYFFLSTFLHILLTAASTQKARVSLTIFHMRLSDWNIVCRSRLFLFSLSHILMITIRMSQCRGSAHTHTHTHSSKFHSSVLSTCSQAFNLNYYYIEILKFHTDYYWIVCFVNR